MNKLFSSKVFSAVDETIRQLRKECRLFFKNYAGFLGIKFAGNTVTVTIKGSNSSIAIDMVVENAKNFRKAILKYFPGVDCKMEKSVDENDNFVFTYTFDIQKKNVKSSLEAALIQSEVDEEQAKKMGEVLQTVNDSSMTDDQKKDVTDKLTELSNSKKLIKSEADEQAQKIAELLQTVNDSSMTDDQKKKLVEQLTELSGDSGSGIMAISMSVTKENAGQILSNACKQIENALKVIESAKEFVPQVESFVKASLKLKEAILNSKSNNDYEVERIWAARLTDSNDNICDSALLSLDKMENLINSSKLDDKQEKMNSIYSAYNAILNFKNEA